MKHAIVRRRRHGFTLVELILVMVIVGVIAGVLALQIGPAFQGYAAVARRARLTDQADTALRRIVAEVRSAVPNSLRSASGTETDNTASSCLEMVPTRDGGRFRTAADKTVTTSDPLDLSRPDASFDVLTDFSSPRSPRNTPTGAPPSMRIGSSSATRIRTTCTPAPIAPGSRLST